MNTKIKVVIITNIIPTYREGFYDRLFKREDLDIKVFCQEQLLDMNLISIHEKYFERVEIIKAISARGEKLVWQFIPWRKIVNEFDVIFVEGNPRVISNLVFGTYLRLIKRKVVLWTMAHSYRGNKITENLRLFWSRIFPVIFVYTDKEAEFLRNKGFKNHYILGMNNGLDQQNIDRVIRLWSEEKLYNWRLSKGFENRTIIVSSARVDPKNKFELILEAIPNIVKKFPNLLWCLIGGGSEEEKLKKIANDLRIKDYVSFIGPIYNEEEIAPYFLSSLLFIHPAAIGLSMLHAFGYGLPVIIHGNSNLHGPEYGAFTSGLTGKNFIDNDCDSLSYVIIQILNAPEERNKIKENVKKIAREQYNVDVMEERFVTIAKYVVDHN